MSSNLTCQIVQIWVAIAIWKLGLLCFCETAWKKKSQSDIATSLSRYQTHKMSKKSNWPGRFHGRCCDLFYFTFMSHRTGGDWHRCGNKMSEHQMWLNFICVCWKCHQLSDWWRGGGHFFCTSSWWMTLLFSTVLWWSIESVLLLPVSTRRSTGLTA